MTDRTQQNTRPDPNDEFKRLATQSITDLGHEQAAASVPGASGYDDPRQRDGVVDAVFDDPRIQGAEHVTVAVPRGDTVALDEVRNRLEDEHTRSAGASILVEGKPSTGNAPAADQDPDVPQLSHADGWPQPHPDAAAEAEAEAAISTDGDLRADTRDQRADRRDGVNGRGDASAASDRSAARRDRQASVGDRRHAKDDREAAATDRRSSAAAASTPVNYDVTESSGRGPGRLELDQEAADAPEAQRPGGGRSSWSSTSTASKTRTTRPAREPGPLS